jgi:hypothetical protein
MPASYSEYQCGAELLHLWNDQSPADWVDLEILAPAISTLLSWVSKGIGITSSNRLSTHQRQYLIPAYIKLVSAYDLIGDKVSADLLSV